MTAKPGSVLHRLITYKRSARPVYLPRVERAALLLQCPACDCAAPGMPCAADERACADRCAEAVRLEELPPTEEPPA